MKPTKDAALCPFLPGTTPPGNAPASSFHSVRKEIHNHLLIEAMCTGFRVARRLRLGMDDYCCAGMIASRNKSRMGAGSDNFWLQEIQLVRDLAYQPYLKG